MRYRKDVHRYRKMVRKRQRAARIRGAVLLSLSLSLLLYAIPCFAVSVWDMDGTSHSSAVIFSTDVKEDKYAAQDPEQEGAAAKQYALVSIGETVGPGVIADDAVVDAAKRRAEAVTIAQSEIDSQLMAKQAKEAPVPSGFPSIAFAIVSFILSIIFAISGLWNIMRSRTAKGHAIAKAYSSALRAV